MHIDGGRLWDALEAMARFGATPAGGNNRLALTDADRDARDRFVEWAREAGCRVTVDAAGNMFARREGSDPEAPPVMAGSHLDTQPTGGRYDGVFGVLAALEAVRALNDHGVRTARPIEVVNWTNEEGARFQPACAGSGVFCGAYALERVYAGTDRDGRRFGDELERIGYRGDAPAGARPVHAYVEAHIEQGPVLEREGRLIGAVTGIQGKRAYRVTVTGTNAHAGTTPMPGRHDALVGAAHMVGEVERLVRALRPDAVATVGAFAVDPGSPNVIARGAAFTIDLRCPEEGPLDEITAAYREAFAAIAAERGLAVDWEDLGHTGPVTFHEPVIALVEGAAGRLGYPARRIDSGAGHDAKYMARLCPTGMIFIPCAEGISHNEAERITPEHAAAGANVLLHTLADLAGTG